MNYTRPATLLLALSLTGTAVAEHSAEHVCNWSIDGYKTGRFSISSEGHVNDGYTGLQWQRCSLGMNWIPSQNTCLGYPQSENWKTTLNTVELFNSDEANAGRSGNWRLPNLKELSTLVSMHCVYPAIDEETFPYAASSYWSSTPFTGGTITTVAGAEYAAWAVNFLKGSDSAQAISLKMAARLVREIPQ